MSDVSVVADPVADPATGTGDAAGRSLTGWLPRPWLFPLLVFAAACVMLISSWLLGDAAAGHRVPAAGTFALWDSQYYARIALGGYGHAASAAATLPPSRAAFFPLYPIAIKAVLLVIGDHVLRAALITQILAGAASAAAVWALARHVYGGQVANRAVLLYCAFPGGTELGWLYPEPLGIALGAGCLLAALKRKWVLAGVLALLAGAEHSTFLVLCPVLGFVAVREIRLRRDWRALIAPVLAPLGALAFFAVVGHAYHDYLFWFHAEEAGWHEHMDFGLHTLSVVTWANPAVWKAPIFYAVETVLFWIAVGGVAWLVKDRAPLPVTLFTAFALAMCYASQAGPKPRYVFTMAGLYLIYAAKLPRRAFWPVLAACAALEAFLYAYWPHTVHAVRSVHGLLAP